MKFNTNGKFKILQLTDIHYVEGNEEDQKTINLIERLIDLEHPDFIMITGDTVYGEKNLENVEKALKPVTDSNIPWSFVFGNHDTENGIGYEKLFPEFLRQPGCLAYHEKGSGAGVGNHCLKLYGTDDVLKWVFLCLDSGNYNENTKVGGYAYIKQSQIDWYRRKIQEMENCNPDFSALAFFHIALCEFRDVWNMEPCHGEKNEEVCCSPMNSGLFTAMLEEGHTKGVFVGHDHINDYYGALYGITLGYGRATGYHTYGKEGYQRGGRIILLDEKNPQSFVTYERLEDGSISKQREIHQPQRQ